MIDPITYSKEFEERLQILISKEDSGTRLDHFLSKKFTYHSRTVWQKEITEGRILVSSKTVKPGVSLKEGDLVSYHPIQKEEPTVRNDYKILYEDEFFVAVDKPGDLPIHPAGIYRKGNLLTFLKESGRFIDLFTVHRLDRETSGVVLFAKNSEIASSLSKSFSLGNIQKYYITKVYGSFPKRKSAYGILKPDLSSKVRKKRTFVPLKFNFLKRNKKYLFENSLIEKQEEISLTYFQKIKFDRRKKSEFKFSKIEPQLQNVKDKNIELIFLNQEKDYYSLLLCKPITGRMHQIRATLYSLGFPLFGDKLYGKDEEVFLEFIEGKNPDLIARLGMKRQALHSYAVCLNHPVTNKKIKITAPIPEDFL
ncbi:RluA family pseudouridine synthase [Leptospira noguchii]|uniref:RluA family pseudouridine synthase n=1 Tax=Leptospira noguchii TaxID=28182 RepID=UPI001FB7479F|nr:RluA family pseudouridine synthase [Leptospira noguchii]UOG29330.1 RluA family pseudouridine synthase [Leptospira noguchii]UOG35326.1 RluA family pseudouridine synthase [Leptospira noguchii]UOG46242.1 RluA family pseudouridine synthase [Leptospira noguchii]